MYIVEKKVGTGPVFYEDAWQPYWEEMRNKYLAFGELPTGYEALCVTNDQAVAASAVIEIFGVDDEETQNLQSCWPHLDWSKLKKWSA